MATENTTTAVEANKNPLIADAMKSEWNLKGEIDYGDGCIIGRQAAADFMKYLFANSTWVGANELGRIVSQIDFDDEDQRGVWVGFFSYLEYALIETLAEPQALLEKLNKKYEVAA